VPLFAPADSELKSLAAAPLGLLPKSAAAPAGDEEGWRDAYLRILAEKAELEERLFAKEVPGDPGKFDRAYWARNPLRVEGAVLGRDASPYRGSVLISAGTREGIRKGLPVVVGDRLVGLVAEAGALTSRVRLLTDPGAAVWAQVLSGEGAAEGAVLGTGSDHLSMERVRAGAASIGSPVYTAGGAELVPRGLLVGTVDRVEDIDRNGVAEIEVKPALAAGGIEIVNVLVPPE
jgi:hypothetical protein